MASVKLAYVTPVALTITLASLASDTNLLAGKQSSEIDNSTNLYLDYLLSGQVTVGTTPTTAREILIYVAGLMGNAGYGDTITNAGDASKTMTSVGIRDGYLKLAARMLVDSATSNRAYTFGPISLAALFGGVAPRKFVVFVVHNTGVALNATGGNHFLYVEPVYETVA